MAMTDQARALLSAKNALKKKWGAEVFRDSTPKEYESYSSGSAKLDAAIGNGGFVKGRIVEFSGAESSGKTSLATVVCISAQRDEPEKFIGYIDLEHAFNTKYSQTLGLNISEDAFLFAQPDSAEEAMDIMLNLCESGACSVVVIDSVGAMQTKRMIEKGPGDGETMAEVPRLLSAQLPKIVKAAARTNTLVIFVNQIREKLGMFVSGVTTMGGKALPFYCSTRIRVKKQDVVIENDKAIGQLQKFEIIKNKVGDPFGVVETSFLFGKGFDPVLEVVDIAIELGIIVRGGAWYYVDKGLDTEEKFQGKANVVVYLSANRDKLEAIRVAALSGHKVAIDASLVAIEEEEV